MPKDDWEKYTRRDRARRALSSGEYDRVHKNPKRQLKQNRKRKKPVQTTHMDQPKGTIAVKSDGFVICYAGTPETARVRYVIKGDLSKGMPPWPGFT